MYSKMKKNIWFDFYFILQTISDLRSQIRYNFFVPYIKSEYVFD